MGTVCFLKKRTKRGVNKFKVWKKILVYLKTWIIEIKISNRKYISKNTIILFVILFAYTTKYVKFIIDPRNSA